MPSILEAKRVYQRYPKYKDINLGLTTRIPERWMVKKAKYIGRIKVGGTPSTQNIEYWENGSIPWLPSGKVQNCYINEADTFITETGLQNSASKIINPSSVLVALTGATCGNIGYLTFGASTNQSIVAIEPFNVHFAKYLYYFLLSQLNYILSLRVGGAQGGINLDDVRNLLVTVPERENYSAIASFLDQETGKIDRLIEKKQKLVELLREKRTALISNAVTKGLDTNAKMKDSGVEWIGKIPKHWEIKRLKYLDKIIMGQSPESEECNKDGIGIPFLQGNADFSSMNPMPSVWCEQPNKIAKEDDVLLSVRAPVGAINIAEQTYGIGRGLCAIRPKHSRKKYLYYRALCIVDELNRIATGSIYTAVSVEQVNNVFVPNPTSEEQKVIVDYLDLETERIDKLTLAINDSIEKLKEYRTALISEAVTGKIKV